MGTPCIEYSLNGGIEYSLNGELHRSNGPAWMNSRSGHTPPGFYWHWRLFGARQRYYGPQCTNGEWWIHGEMIK